MRLFFLAVVAATVSCVANNPQSSGAGGAPPSNGGAPSSGGLVSSGGKPSSGGVTSSGGLVSSGGKPSSGGTMALGGSTSLGGAPSSGGSSQPATSVNCPDVSQSFSNQVSGQYGGTQISVDNNSAKTYFMQANWWGTPFGNQTESVNGIGFTMTNSANTVTSNPSLPLGFPSIFIGAYQAKKTTGSNLPKQVSALTSIPTIFSTNTDQKGYTSYNATYDVWFTQGNGLVSGGNPGSGGAYLMVWLFKPTDKSPRGTLKANGTTVDGVSGSWDVWYDPSPSDNMPCVSYVSNPDKLASIQFDLNYFIKDAVAKNYGVNNNQYLSIIFAGFEVWGGGSGLQVKQFCANVE